MIRLLVLDLDGTLLNSSKEISPGNRAAVIAAQEKGVRVALASGRNYLGLREVCHQLELDTHGGFVVGNNGQDLYDFGRRELTQGEKVCRFACLETMELAHRRSLEVFGHNNGVGCYYSPPGDVPKLYPDRPSRRYDEAAGFFDEPGDMDKIGLFVAPGGLDPYEVLGELRTLVGDAARCILVDPECIELVPPGMDKSVGVDAIAARCGFAREEVLVLGDGQNDLGMARKYPFVAMANALEEVKAAALRMTLSNDDDGVAAEIQKSIL